MKKLVLSIVVCALSATAHAQLVAPKGAKATLKVEYTYLSAGDFWGSARDTHDTWNVKRTATMTAVYAADAPQAFGMLHSKDAKQNQDIQQVQAKANATMAKMQPTMGDMMKIVQDCGGGDTKESQACIEKKVSNYGNNMSDAQLGQMKSAGEDVSALNKMATGNRFQLWKLTSQSGEYLVSEDLFHQVFEMTCTATKPCKRTTRISGGGKVPAPPGGASIAGASVFEVDSEKHDLVLQLPVPLAALDAQQTVVTNIQGETGGTSRVTVRPWMMPAMKPMTISIATDLRSVSGQKDIEIPGRQHEGGVLRVSWQFFQQ